MFVKKSEFDDLFELESLVDIRHGISRIDGQLSLSEARKISVFAQSLSVRRESLKMAFIHTYTSELLDPWLHFHSALNGVDCEIYHASYGLALQEAQAGSELLEFKPDITILLLQESDLDPALTVPITDSSRDEQDEVLFRSINRFKMIVEAFRSQAVGLIVVTLLPTCTGPSLGLYDRQSENSESRWQERLSNACADYLREDVSSSLYLDMKTVISSVGLRQFFDLRLWYAMKFPFSTAAACEFSQKLITIGEVLIRKKAKVIVVDADNTLWGGVIGEDGIENIKLGPEFPGVGYLQFQRRLLDFKQRGFILALCSKNNESDVDEVLENHSHQLLKKHDFAAKRVNWLPKPQNLCELALELNVGLDSMIFADDSDFEVSAVRTELPEVEVIKVPSKEVDVAHCLDNVSRLEVISVTEEDRNKTQMYLAEHQRNQLKDKHMQGSEDSLSSYLNSLQMVMEVSFDDNKSIGRLSQLTQKTNQFNLTTKRYDETEIKSMVDSNQWVVAQFSLKDVFGDSGIVGLALARLTDNKRAKIDTFLMSCRVIGRGAEHAFFNAILHKLIELKIQEVELEYIATRKNIPIQKFLTDSIFSQVDVSQYIVSIDTDTKPILMNSLIDTVYLN